jgi:hypothetical protein
MGNVGAIRVAVATIPQVACPSRLVAARVHRAGASPHARLVTFAAVTKLHLAGPNAARLATIPAQELLAACLRLSVVPAFTTVSLDSQVTSSFASIKQTEHLSVAETTG